MVVWIEILPLLVLIAVMVVTTCVVVWIEICIQGKIREGFSVTTCVVVWIEIAGAISFF